MLSTKVFSSASNAQKYYSHADYYGAEAKGVWFGEGTKDFNLQGAFDAKTDEKFKDLLNGKMHNGRLLGNLDKDGNVIHRPGVDLTFSSPKSISIQMQVLGSKKEKEELSAARTRALHSTLRYIEASDMIYTRKGAGGIIREPINNLTFALFAHTTNRKLEPQDHTHCLLANAAKCSDGKYRTIVWDEVLKNNKYIGQIFRNELALEVQKLGYKIRTTLLSDGSSSFELKNISQNLIDAFSTRRKEIVELFKFYDVKTKEGKDRIVINSRESKKTVPESKLKETWAKVVKTITEQEKSKPPGNVKDRVIEKVRDFLDVTIYKSDIEKIELPQDLTVAETTKLAIQSITYNNSVFTKEELFKASLKYGIGKYNIKDINQDFKELVKTKDIVASDRGENVFTTKELLIKEKEILSSGKRGIGKCGSIIKKEHFVKRFKLYEKQSQKDFKLNKQQRNAVKHIVTSKDKVTAIQGLPGVGKSTVLEAVKDMTGGKINPLGTAPTASAAKTLQDSSGIESKTLHSFIGKHRGYLEGRGVKSLAEMQSKFKKSIVFVDEASLVGTRQMHDLLNLSEILKFRVVLIGDTKQLGAVEAGKPFEQLLDVVNSVKLDTILRQKDKEHIKAVADTANNKILDSFKIHEQNIKGSKQFVNQAVRKYLSLNEKEKDNTVLISPSRAHRDKINSTIVKHLADKGLLNNQSYRLNVLKPVELAKSDYNKAHSYKAGDIVKFNKGYTSIGIKKGESLKLFESNQSTNTLLFKKGFRNIRFQLKHSIDYTSKLEVFKTDTLEIREGLKLRITKNAHGFINSETTKITSIDAKNKTIELQLGDKGCRKVSFSELKHVDLGYCSTVHSSQGKTTDKLIAALCSHTKLNTQKSWLVSISRHKSDLHIYMQDKEKVQQQLISNKGIERAALDIKTLGKERQMVI
jgi:conjugative relaxase-like TrwC/TraI family protein